MIHELKIYTGHFEQLMSGCKSFEILKNDRGFMAGDYLALNEWDTDSGYTGRCCLVQIMNTESGTKYFLKNGYDAMSIIPQKISPMVYLNELKPPVYDRGADKILRRKRQKQTRHTR